MLSPCSGMNPYLKHPAFWSSFHTRLMVVIAEAAEAMASQLSPQWADGLLVLVRGG